MRLTVLGSCASYAGAGRACSGHLVESGDTRILLDCGNGVLANLACVVDPASLDAVFVTHPHPDHYLDLYALHALLRYAPDGPVAPLRLCAPAGLFERMGCLLSDRGKAELARAFDVEPLVGGSPVVVGDLTVTPHPVDHTRESFALVVEDGRGRLCYTGDTQSGPAAVSAARGADLLLAEATLPAEYAGRAPHMTGRDAGMLALEAGVGALVLTHVWPTASREDIADETRAVWDGDVKLADELATFEVESGRETTDGTT